MTSLFILHQMANDKKCYTVKDMNSMILGYYIYSLVMMCWSYLTKPRWLLRRMISCNGTCMTVRLSVTDLVEIENHFTILLLYTFQCWLFRARFSDFRFIACDETDFHHGHATRIRLCVSAMHSVLHHMCYIRIDANSNRKKQQSKFCLGKKVSKLSVLSMYDTSSFNLMQIQTK